MVIRLGVNQRKCKSMIKPDAWAIQRLNILLEELDANKIISALDLGEGFGQMRGSQIYNSICSSRWTNELNAQPSRLRDPPASFQRLVNDLVSELDTFPSPHG